MRQALRRYGSGTLLCLLGVALLMAGTAASLGYQALKSETPVAATASTDAPSAEGLAVDLGLAIDAPIVPLTPVNLHVDPPLAAAAPLPGVSVDRELSIGREGLGLDASLDLASGSHRAKTEGTSSSVQSASMRAFLAPSLAPVAVAAAAFTLAGAAAYFWGGLKAWGAKHLVLPIIGLYAKISRAEVFDNNVRERIFAAIRDNPGVSASDLSRAADVSWGTTIYHLDVLEQTRMVTSIRKGRYRRYFENGAALTATKDAVAVLRNPVTAGIVETLRALPGVTQKDLAGATHMSPQALHWHLARLVETGLVRKEREGRVVRHFVAAN